MINSLIMLVIQLGCCHLILLFKLLNHLLKLWIPTRIDSVLIQESIVPKGTTPVLQSPKKWNWEIPISDQNWSVFTHLHSLCFHHLKLQFQVAGTKLNNQHNRNKEISFIILKHICIKYYLLFALFIREYC